MLQYKLHSFKSFCFIVLVSNFAFPGNAFSASFGGWPTVKLLNKQNAAMLSVEVINFKLIALLGDMPFPVARWLCSPRPLNVPC